MVALSEYAHIFLVALPHFVGELDDRNDSRQRHDVISHNSQ